MGRESIGVAATVLASRDGRGCGRAAVEVRRVAKERNLTMSRAIVAMAERRVRAETEARENFKATYRRFMKEQEPPARRRPARI